MQKTPREWLKHFRDNKNMTQDDVASAAEIERAYYTMIENGTRTPSVEVAKKIGQTLGFSWTIFFDNDGNEPLQISKSNSQACAG